MSDAVWVINDAEATRHFYAKQAEKYALDRIDCVIHAAACCARIDIRKNIEHLRRSVGQQFRQLREHRQAAVLRDRMINAFWRSV